MMKTVTLYTDGACEAEKAKRRGRFAGRVEIRCAAPTAQAAAEGEKT